MIVPICLLGALEVGHVPLWSWKKEPRDKGTALKMCLTAKSKNLQVEINGDNTDCWIVE